jgi:hypothetical protein
MIAKHYFTWLAVISLGSLVTACTPTTGDEPSPCEDPPNQATGYPVYDSFCRCPPYSADTGAWGNQYLGLARCETKCTPVNPTQTLIRPENDSFDACIKACTGSFEKAKRYQKRQDPDYWFCHGVNFIKGELCEFIGTTEDMTFEAGTSNCWYLDGLD